MIVDLTEEEREFLHRVCYRSVELAKMNQKALLSEDLEKARKLIQKLGKEA